MIFVVGSPVVRPDSCELFYGIVKESLSIWSVAEIIFFVLPLSLTLFDPLSPLMRGVDGLLVSLVP